MTGNVTSANGNVTRVLDVSAAQGPIDWPTLAASGRCEAAIDKATEGNGHVDPSFAANFQGALASGLLLGCYHFAHPDESLEDAAREARHFVSTVQAQIERADRVVGPLLYALDVEEARTIHAGPRFVAWCRAFVEETEALTGLACWVYTGGPFWAEHAGALSAEDAEFFAARCLWIAAYVIDPARFVALTPWRTVGWTLHQQSGDVGPNGAPGIRYPGIPGNVVDTSLFRGSLAEIRALVARGHATYPAPAPEQLSDLSTLSPATPLRAAEGEHTPIHLRGDTES